ncbi:MAG: acetyl-CoA carboxylase biotin carboxylase subunit [Cytophagales bacterium]|nr:acetyl-CoA carboxylase biotin carboxylase subunit [Cytophagales bacterium]
MKNIRKILIANRGEIALRIIQAAKELGIKTVAVFAEVDRSSLHVRKADEVHQVSDRGIEPYLDMDQILNIAELAEADAIHPGYGFLSENHIFAREATIRGFNFIGPSPEAIAMMGDKLMAKKTASSVNVPVIPGMEISSNHQKAELEGAKKIGFPLLIKAKAGGGGKGMRIVHSEIELKEQIPLAVSEAKEAFGDGSVFIEKLIERPRHIEIQVLADKYGNAVHLFERECSIQRRHQKVIEEAPSSVLDEDLRQKMGEAALRLVKACNYSNAGTVEFILDREKNFYFLEMNTRLQVEHPVTEYIADIDLVKEQIRVAEGRRLSYTQSDLKINGHAIELRVYAEDPRNSFLPDTGILKSYAPPRGAGVRLDDGYEQGMEIPVEYDPMIAKLIVHGASRTDAIARMKRAIDDYEIIGVHNTLEFGKWVMEDEDFCSGDFDTSFISAKIDDFRIGGGDEMTSLIAAIAGDRFSVRKTPAKPGKNLKTTSRWYERRK